MTTVLTNPTYATITSHAAGCPVTFELYTSANVQLTAPSNTWITIDSATGTLKVDTNIFGSENVYIKMIDALGNSHQTAVFTVTVSCPIFTLSNIATSNDYVIPGSTAPLSTLALGSSYIVGTTTCTVTYSFIDTSANPWTSTWAVIDASNADITVDINNKNSVQVKVRASYGA